MSGFLNTLGRGIVRWAGTILVGAVFSALLGVGLARHLTIDTDFSNLVPDSHPSVRALETLRQRVGGESGVAVGIVSPSFRANRRFAEDFIARARALTAEQAEGTPSSQTGTGGKSEAYFRRIEFERDVDVLKNNALYFATDRDLRQIETFLRSKMAEVQQRANPFAMEGDQSKAESDSLGRAIEQTYERLVGSRYPISDDSTTMGIRLYPSFSKTEVGMASTLYEKLRGLVDRLDPASYDPAMNVVLAGRLKRQLVEINSVRRDVASSFSVGVGIVLLAVVLYFLYKVYRIRCGKSWRRLCFTTELVRIPLLALVITLPLVMSLAWTGGFAYLVFGDLNLMTSTLGLVLFGLGIDYGIHFYGRYAEERADGVSLTAGITRTLEETGQAIGVSALTTATALYVLTFAAFKGFSEFGAIAGTGILFALVAMTVVMPALMVVLERSGLLTFQPPQDAGALLEERANGQTTARPVPAARAIVVGGILLAGVGLGLFSRIDFEYDFTALSPDFPEYERKARIIDRAFGSRARQRSPAFIVTDEADAIPGVMDALERHRRRDTTGLIRRIESLTERYPLSDSAQQAKLARIAELRKALSAAQSLMTGQGERAGAIGRLLRAAQTDEPIPLDRIPAFLREKFTTADGTVGTFVQIYPSRTLADARNGIAFKRLVGTVATESGATYHAASTSIVAADMFLLMQQEAPWMMGATLIVILLVVFFHFRDPRWTLLALTPLAVGLLWMILGMALLGLKLNFYNMVVLPAILGIGNDAGVHIVHRCRNEGPRSLSAVMRSTGEHVAMGTLTTMIGFGGLLVSFHPGLKTIGVLAVLGLGTTLAATLVFLPALLQWIERGGPVSEGERPLPSDARPGVVSEKGER